MNPLRITTLCFLFSLAWPALSQTVDYVAAGRAYLEQGKLREAHAQFQLAVADAPSNSLPNFFYAATRVLTLPDQPDVAALLNRLGISKTNWNMYSWRLQLPVDQEGAPIAPAGVNASEIFDTARTQLLGQFLGAATNLDRITNPRVTVSLSSNETTVGAITLDYGDIQMIRALAYAASSIGYTLTSMNFDAQLTALRSALTNDANTLESLAQAFPNLLSHSSTQDLARAKAALTNSIAAYFQASASIRARPTNVSRLFMLEAEDLAAEADFRTALSNVLQSVASGPTVLAADTNITINAQALFDSNFSFRALFPQLHEETFVAGTFPGFRGVVSGVPNEDVESALADVIDASPRLQASRSPSGQLIVQLQGIKETGYRVEVSADLTTWTPAATLIAENGRLDLSSFITPASQRQFVRVILFGRADTGGPIVQPGELPSALTGKKLEFNFSAFGEEEITFLSSTQFLSSFGAAGQYSFSRIGNSASLVLDYQTPAEFADDHYTLALNFSSPSNGTVSGILRYEGAEHPAAGTFLILSN